MVFDGYLKGRCATLRAVTLDDCDSRYLSWMTDPEINRYMETRWSCQTSKTIEDFVTSIRSSSHSYLFAILSDGNHVGNIKIGPIDSRYKNADISYFIGEPHVQGRGLATDAVRLVVDFGFEKLGLHRIQAGAFRENSASRKVLEKNGFRQEGVFREKYFLTDESNWTDGYQYGILRSQWEENRKHEIG
jgi:RimJ/RimL family protein N-acetyltransferase